MRFHPTAAVLAAALAGVLGVTARSAPQSQAPAGPASASATESNPAGDIPDTQAFVTATGPSGKYQLQVPEGWAESRHGTSVSYTDKLNSISVDEMLATAAPTLQSVTGQEVPQLKSSTSNFAIKDVTAFTLPGGTGTLIRYQADSTPDPVTGKVRRQALERYLFWKNGTRADLTLAGPQGADNADPWAKVSGSFRWLK